jgi:hypothetical protein
MSASSFLGTHKLHIHLTAVSLYLWLGFYLGTNKCASGESMAVLRRFTTAAYVTLRPISDKSGG